MGAEYAEVTESSDITWSEARAKCQSAGGDLASVHSWPVQWKLNSFSLWKDFWIGATDEASEGTFTWVDNVAWEFHNWDDCNAPSNDAGKNCVIMGYGKYGRWENVECDKSGVKSFICQKGTSTSTLWTEILGAHYSYNVHDDCIDDWDDAKTLCRGYGGSMASLLHDDVVEGIKDLYGNAVSEDYWIGLNDKATEGTYVWDKGEEFAYSKWKTGEPNAYGGDCARARSSDHKWEMKNCGYNYVAKGVLCMKGTSSSVAAPTPAPASGPAGISNTNYYKKYHNRNCILGDTSSNPHKSNLANCCTWCLANHGSTNKVSVRPNNHCECVNSNDDDCETWHFYYSRRYDTADCSGGRRKKRSANDHEEDQSYQTLLSHNLRSKRSTEVDTLNQRLVKCEAIWGGTGGYWHYQHEVPSSCYRINCTLSDIEAISADNTDVELLNFNSSNLYYQKSYR